MGVRQVGAALAIALAVGTGAPAHAALYTSVLHNVVILGTTYDVTFSQFDGGLTFNSFDAFYGSSIPVFTFTTAVDAHAAIQAITAANMGDVVDITPAPDSDRFAYRVPIFADSTVYSYRTYFNGGSFPANPSDSFAAFRTDGNFFSMVSFQEVTATPAPASALVLASGLAGLALVRRRHKA